MHGVQSAVRHLQTNMAIIKFVVGLLLLVTFRHSVLIPSANGMKSKSESVSSSREESQPSGSNPTSTRGESGDGSGSSRRGSSSSKSSDSSGMNSRDTDSDMTDLDTTGDDSGKSSHGNSESGSMDRDHVGSRHSEDTSGSKSNGPGSSGNQSGGSSNSESSSSEEGQSDRMSTTPLTTGATTSQTTEFQETTVVTSRDGEITLQVCEHQTLMINCEEGEIQVHYALYGRNNREDCPGRGVPSFVPPCASPTSLSVVKEECENKSTCMIFASNDAFDDPCVNVFKYLEVEYSCSDVHSSSTFETVQPDNCFTEKDIMCNVTMILGKIDLINITKENAPNVAETLFNVSTEVNLLSGSDIDSIANNVLKLVQLDEQAEVGVVTGSIIGIVNNLYNVSSEVIAKSTTVGVLSEALETQLGNTVSSNRNFTEVMLPNVRAIAAPVDQASLEIGLSFCSSFLDATSRQKTTDLINFSPPNIRVGVSSCENLSSFIELPRSIGDRLRAGGDSSVPLTFILYKNANIFPMPPASITNCTKVRKAISSQVIAANVAGMEIKNLPNNDRVMTKFFSFPVASKYEKEDKRECVFWEYDTNTQRGKWSTEGCEMSGMSKEGHVTCLCNHLTSFAVLVVASKYEKEDKRECVFWEYDTNTQRGKWSTEGCEMSGMSKEGHVTCLCNHLTSFAVLVHISKESRLPSVVVDIITDIGSGISIIGLLICVATIVAIKSVREKQQSHVHINLCIALIAFYLTFLIGVDRTDNPVWCQITASFIHFFSLSSMAWMTVEAVLFYNMVNKLNRTGVKFLLPVGMVFAWGVPLVAALVVTLLDGSHDYECSPDYCFLHPGLGLYLGYLLLIFLMFVFNTIMFFVISCKFACRTIIAKDEKKRAKEMRFRIRGIFLFWLLMGMSWIFGLLAIIPSPIKILFDILFSLFMALQGFAMFYLLTVTNSDVKKLVNWLKCFDENMFSLISKSRSSRSSRSTTNTTQGSQKSQSNDQTNT